ncbi:MAG TPA: hypothetical protein VHN99_04955, partial [Deinococcales bacterium]|nr:hypothetical protein [Deinococcales bacterium]
MTLPATPPAAPRKRQPARLRVAAWAAAAAVALAPAVLTAAGAQTVPCALSEDQARADLTLTTDAALVARARGELAELNGQAALPVDTLASLLNLPLGHDVGGG